MGGGHWNRLSKSLGNYKSCDKGITEYQRRKRKRKEEIFETNMTRNLPQIECFRYQNHRSRKLQDHQVAINAK